MDLLSIIIVIMFQKKKLVIVDGSGYLFRAYYALPPLIASDGTPTGVVYGVSQMLKRLLNDVSPDYFVVVFDARKKTFRHEMYSKYKANRPPTPPDLVVQFEPLMDLLNKLAYPLLQIEGYEADDVLGTLAKQGLAENCAVTVVTGDKDLMQLVEPGVQLFDPMKRKTFDEKGVKEKIGVLPNQMVEYLMLVGDNVDNIPGVRGIGPKTAVNWLQTYGSLNKVLEQCDKCKQKIEKALSAQEEDLDLLRRLVTIDCNVPFNGKVTDFCLGAPDVQGVKDIYARLGFQKLFE